MRVLVAATGWPGHVFPAIALALALRERGHEVVFATGLRFRAAVEEQSLAFAEVPAYTFLGFPPDEGRLPGASRVAASLVSDLGGLRPDLVVSDIFTVAPALAAEAVGAPVATLVPYHYPVIEPGAPFFAGLPFGPVGLMPPRSRIGTAAWRAAHPLNVRWSRRQQQELNRVRRELGLAPRPGLDGLISRELALIATFPQLEHRRRWPPHVELTGPMLFDLPSREVELPPGAGPLVVVAGSTLHDPGLQLIGKSLAALGGEPVRVLAAINLSGRAWEEPVPPNARVVEWAPYSQVIREASLVICHGGHGTVARSIAEGVPVLVCPAWGDQADNGVRAARAGVGLMIPRRVVSPRSIRWAVRRMLSDPTFTRRAGELAAWARDHEGAARGARLSERLVGGGDYD